MMPLFLLVLSKICQVVSVDTIIQDSGVIGASVGEDVTLRCTIQGNSVSYLYWFQQILLDKHQLISSRMRHSPKADIFTKYQDRFKVFVDSKTGTNDLIISDLRQSDSAMYYCGMQIFDAIEFGQGVFLHVKPSHSNISVHQPAAMSLQLGHSGNLSCTVYSEPCAGGQTFYWLRKSRSQPAVVYLSEGWCRDEGKVCTSDFLIKPERSSDPGIYYCVVDTCREVVYGEGTMVEIKRSTNVSPSLVSSLTVSLAVSLVVLLVLVFKMCKLKNKMCTDCKGIASEQTHPAAFNNPDQDGHSLHYAALSVATNTECHHPEEMDCVYSGVRKRNE